MGIFIIFIIITLAKDVVVTDKYLSTDEILIILKTFKKFKFNMLLGHTKF